MYQNKNDRAWERDCPGRLDDLVILCFADDQLHEAEEFRDLTEKAFDDTSIPAVVKASFADPTNGYVGIANSLRGRLKKQGWLEKKKVAGRLCYRVRKVPDYLMARLDRLRANEEEDRARVLDLLTDAKGHESREVFAHVQKRTVADETSVEEFARAYRAVAALKREKIITSRVVKKAGADHEHEELLLD